MKMSENVCRILKDRQINWAQRKGIDLVGSVWLPGVADEKQDLRGEKAYTKTLDANLFRPLNNATIRDFRRGKGRELDCKLRAVHGSAALAANVFDYWRGA
jgi:hypothetical protein